MDLTGLEPYVDSYVVKKKKEKLYFLSDPERGGISSEDHPQTYPIANNNG